MPRRRAVAQMGIEAEVGKLLDAFVVDVRHAVAETVLPALTSAFEGAPSVSPPAPGADATANGHALDPAALDAVLGRVVRERAVTPREAALLGAAVHGVPRSRLAEVLGTSENTIKTQARTLLRKLGHSTLDEAMWWIRGQVTRAVRRGPGRLGRAKARRG